MDDPAAGLASRGARVALTPAGKGRLDIVRLTDHRTIGRLDVAVAAASELTVWELCIDDPERGYGAGSEAALLFVSAAHAAGWRTLRARAHPRFGLSVYFWMRMGFRPLHGEGPEGGIWFVRQLGGDGL